MSDHSHIEWTDATWNPVAGCTPVSPGCLNCYAATMAYRLDKMGQKKYRRLTLLRNDVRTFSGKINLVPDALAVPLSWKKPRRVFVNSMSDLFHEDVPFEFVKKVWDVISKCPQHTFQILTKRPERLIEFHHWLAGCDDISITEWPRNTWIGTSVEDQQRADERIPHLLKCPAAVRFLSCEPLLGPINLQRIRCLGAGFVDALDGRGHDGSPTGGKYHKDDSCEGSIDWVIVGGESGPNARPCYTNWIDGIVSQCKAASVPVFVKQLGSNHRCIDEEFGDVAIKLKDLKGGDISEFPQELRLQQFPTTHFRGINKPWAALVAAEKP